MMMMTIIGKAQLSGRLSCKKPSSNLRKRSAYLVLLAICEA